MKQLGVVKRNNWFQWSRVEKYGFHSCCVPQNPQPKKVTFIIFYLFFMSRTALIEHLTQYQKAESSLWSYLLEVFNWDFATMSLTICYNPVRFGKLSPQFDVIWFHYTAYSLRFLCRPFDIHDILCNYPLGVPRQELWADLAECRQPKIWQVVHLLVLFVFGVATCVLDNSFTAQSLKFPDSFHKAIGCEVAKCWFIFILPSKSSSWNGACVIRRLIFIWIKVREA